MQAPIWLEPSKLSDKVILDPTLVAEGYTLEDARKQEPQVRHFDQKSQNLRILKFTGKQGGGAGALIGYSLKAADWQTIWTGVLNFARNGAWLGTHKGINFVENVATLKSKLKTDFQFAQARVTGKPEHFQTALNSKSTLDHKREKIGKKIFGFVNRNVTHNMVNAFFALMGAVVHVPQMMAGWAHGQMGHLLGAGIALLGYVLLSAGYFDKGLKNLALKKAIQNGDIAYNPKTGLIVPSYTDEGNKTKHILFEVLPPLKFMAKGVFYMYEALHLTGDDPLAAAFIAASGILFISSGKDEFRHLNHQKLEAFAKNFNRQVHKKVDAYIHKYGEEGATHIAHIIDTFNALKRTFRIKPKSSKKDQNETIHKIYNTAAKYKSENTTKMRNHSEKNRRDDQDPEGLTPT